MYHVIHTRKEQLDRFHVVIQDVEKSNQVVPYSYICIPSGVTVIPILEDGSILVQKEYRHPVGSWEYEFPSGVIDEGEDAPTAMCREVQEETGCKVLEAIELGRLYPSFGATNETIYLFAAYVQVPGGMNLYDDSNTHGRELLEEIRMETMTTAELEELIRNDQFRHGAGLAAWLKWKLYKSVGE